MKKINFHALEISILEFEAAQNRKNHNDFMQDLEEKLQLIDIKQIFSALQNCLKNQTVNQIW